MVAFSILVPTYNRANLLPDFFAALDCQTFTDFELIIVDDGSTDDSSEVVHKLSITVSFSVRYFKQNNSGRATALNRALRESHGELIMFMDDDDKVSKDGLKILWDAWVSIPANEKPSFCGVCGLCSDPDGNIIGNIFPGKVFDSDFFTIRTRYKIKGDKKEAVARASIGAFQFSVFPGEKRSPTSLLWFKLAQHYKTRFINSVCVIKNYLSEGMSCNIDEVRRKSPFSSAHYYKKILEYFPEMKVKEKIRFGANLIRYGLHAGYPTTVLLQGLSGSAIHVLVIVLGGYLWLKDLVCSPKKSKIIKND